MTLGTKFHMNNYIKTTNYFSSSSHKHGSCKDRHCFWLWVPSVPHVSFTRPSLKEINKNVTLKYFGTVTVSF